MGYMEQKRLSIKEEQFLIGHIIRSYRRKQQIKINELACNIKKSKQYLSEIEIGSKTLSYSTIIQIFKYLHIDFTFEYFNVIGDDFSEFIDLFYFHDLANAKHKLYKIINNKIIKYSLNYPTFVLVQFIIEVMEHKNVIYTEEIDYIYTLLSKTQQSIYYFFRGLVEYSKNNNNESIKCYEYAIENVGSISFFQAIIETRLALAFEKNNNILKAIDYNRQAYLGFTANNNPARAITNELYIGNEYSKLFFIDKSIELYKKTLKDARRFNIFRIIGLVYCNLSVSYLYCKKYEKAIEIALEGINQVKNPSVLLYVLSWSYYELGDLSKSKKCLNRLQEVVDKTIYIEKIVNIQVVKLNKGKKSKDYLVTILELYKHNINNEMPSEQLFSLELIIDYYELKKDYENAYMYSAKLLGYYNRTSDNSNSRFMLTI